MFIFCDSNTMNCMCSNIPSVALFQGESWDCYPDAPPMTALYSVATDRRALACGCSVLASALKSLPSSRQVRCHYSTCPAFPAVFPLVNHQGDGSSRRFYIWTVDGNPPCSIGISFNSLAGFTSGLQRLCTECGCWYSGNWANHCSRPKPHIAA